MGFGQTAVDSPRAWNCAHIITRKPTEATHPARIRAQHFLYRAQPFCRTFLKNNIHPKRWLLDKMEPKPQRNPNPRPECSNARHRAPDIVPRGQSDRFRPHTHIHISPHPTQTLLPGKGKFCLRRNEWTAFRESLENNIEEIRMDTPSTSSTETSPLRC